MEKGDGEEDQLSGASLPSTFSGPLVLGRNALGIDSLKIPCAHTSPGDLYSTWKTVVPRTFGLSPSPREPQETYLSTTYLSRPPVPQQAVPGPALLLLRTKGAGCS